ncbi:MAG: hypothetical protein K6D97_05395 [Clostridia bacterium]|nr:hypothetical protein [Clostridia bacterium]
MEERDLFWVTDDKGNKLQMEAVVMYSIKLTGFNYIIYRDIDQSNYYVAKFKDDDVQTMITDLDEKEYSYAKIVLNEVM